jgi:AbrB family looped-hinge helix DNA binding protein
MRVATISKGGQISIPADIRHRWGVKRVMIIESETSLVLRPLPDDPIAAAKGILRDPEGHVGLTTEEALAQLDDEDDYVYRRRGWT